MSISPMPDHAKEKILKFFLKTSVPRIIEAERKAKKIKIGNGAQALHKKQQLNILS